jgi:uncharacterized surface protein with fasciclin (FAS1) repeats
MEQITNSETETMKRFLCMLALAAMTFTTASTARAADIVDTAVGAGSFNTLVAAVKAGGLVKALKGDGPFTVFAPTDAAFAALPEGTLEMLLKPENKDKLIEILKYHVVAGKVMAADVVTLDSADTLAGKKVAIKVVDGKVLVNKSTVTKTDIVCDNGVIHVIDAVLLPPAAK